MRCLFVLLLLSTSLWAQPVEGPWEIWAGEHDITSPEVCVRGSNADILFIENDSVRYARFSLESHQVITPPHPVFALQGWNTQTLHDLICVSDTTWACLVYEDERPMLPGDDNNFYNRTSLLTGTDAEVLALPIDSGLTHWYFGQPGEYFNEGFSLTDRVGGGMATGWIRIVHGLYDPEMCAHFRSYQADLSNDFRAETCIGIGYLYYGNRVLPQSLSADTFLVVSATLPLASAVCTNPDEYYSAVYGSQGTGFTATIGFGLTQSGLIRVLAAAENEESSVTHSLSMEISEGGGLMINELDSLGVPPLSCRTIWHPRFGFALVHASPSSLQLARADTNGAQSLPTGTLFWRDDQHMFAEANLTITDGGEIVAIWTEKADGDTAARRVMLGSVGWETLLAVKPSDFIPHPSSFILSCFPNPFNGELRIQYVLPHAGHVEVSVRNVLGQMVATLDEGMRSAGAHRAVWSSQAGSGIYFVTLRTEETVRTQKVLLTR